MSALRRYVLGLCGLMISPTGLVGQTAGVDLASLAALAGAERAAVLERPANLTVRGAPLPDALETLAHTADVTLAFSPSDLSRAHRVVDCECGTVSVREALHRMLRLTSFDFMEVRDQIVVYSSTSDGRGSPASRNGSVNFASLPGTLGVPERSAFRKAYEIAGTITGRVTDASTLQPIPGAQVFIPTLSQGTISDSDGRFMLLNVPDGQVVVRVQVIGYETTEQTVTVQADASANVNFALQGQALALDEIVVTGTAGQARRREVGNAIAQVQLDEIIATPALSVGQLLQGRLAGVNISAGSGNSGSAMDIRFRGNVSMTMGNSPLIYIDGQRVKSDPFLSSGGAADPIDPLSGLNPSDIERIEIVKGPAATTLYGTEAAAGVIQIVTKRGSGGAPRWTASTQQGISYFRPFGANGVDYMFLDPVLRKGHRQRYATSVSGGNSDQLGYFVSAAYEDNNGAVITDAQKGVSVRANMQMRAHEDLLLNFNNSYSRTELSQVRQGNTTSGIVMTAIRGPLSYMGDREPSTLRTLLSEQNLTFLNRYTGGLTANYTATPNFTHRLTVGYDFAQMEVEREQPYCWRCTLGFSGDLGSISRVSNQTSLTSIDYAASLGLDITDNLRSTSSFGIQGSASEVETISASGQDFPGPGTHTISSAADISASQSKLRIITGGFFLQEMLGLADRYFLTVGLRVDGNSAFGEALGLQPYPKVAGSYVISDEAFWPESFGEWKLRAAYGLAGRAPGAFDAVRTWSPVQWGNNAMGFLPGNLGNPDLGPEKTSEFEVGFDGTILDGRLSTELTYYNQTTRDALFRVGRPASEGNWNSQLENVGIIDNSGLEVQINATLLDRRSFRWDLGLGVATNSSEIVSLGDSPSFPISSGSVTQVGWVIEGQPAPVIRADRIMNYWEKAEPIISKAEIYGPAYPTHTFNINSSITLPGGVMLSGHGEYRGGHYMSNYFEAGALWRTISFPKCYPAYQKVDPSWVPGPLGENTVPVGTSEDLYAWERAQCFGMATNDLTTGPADFFELRNLTMSVPVSEMLPSLSRMGELSLTLSANNVWLWKNNKIVWTGHPEQHESDGGSQGHDLVKGIDETLPPQSSFTISVQAVF